MTVEKVVAALHAVPQCSVGEARSLRRKRLVSTRDGPIRPASHRRFREIPTRTPAAPDFMSASHGPREHPRATWHGDCASTPRARSPAPRFAAGSRPFSTRISGGERSGPRRGPASTIATQPPLATGKPGAVDDRAGSPCPSLLSGHVRAAARVPPGRRSSARRITVARRTQGKGHVYPSCVHLAYGPESDHRDRAQGRVGSRRR